MKVTTKAVYDVKGNLVFEEKYEYIGELSLCGGGSKGASTPDVTPAPPPVEKVQTKAISESAKVARDNQLEKSLKSKGIKSSILTNTEEEASLLSSVNNTKSTNTKSLLGQ